MDRHIDQTRRQSVSNQRLFPKRTPKYTSFPASEQVKQATISTNEFALLHAHGISISILQSSSSTPVPIRFHVLCFQSSFDIRFLALRSSYLRFVVPSFVCFCFVGFISSGVDLKGERT